MGHEKPTSFSILPKLINGGIAGIIGVSAVFPLDLVKTRLQNQQIGPNGERMYNSIIDCFRKTFTSEGFLGMYRGSAINILLITPEKGVKLASNDFFRYHLASDDGKITIPRQGLAGGLAGVFQSLLSTPMELLKIQMQDAGRVERSLNMTGKVKRETTTHMVKRLLQEKGVLGLYKGVGATAARDILFSIIYFPFMATLNDKGPRKLDDSGEAVFYWTSLSGLTSGTVSAFLVTPLDVIKTRLQAMQKAKGEHEFNGIIDCFQKTLKHEGIRAFFKGGLCRIMVIAPLYAVTQTVYFLGVGERLLGIRQTKSV